MMLAGGAAAEPEAVNVTTPPGSACLSSPALATGGVVLVADRSAATASSIPAPQSAVVHVDPAGNGRAVARSFWRTSAAVSAGFSESISDATPETWGAAMLVPWRKA